MRNECARFLAFVGVSIFFHAAVIAVACFFSRLEFYDFQSAADELPQLDLSRVDLSFSEDEQESAPPVMSEPSAPAESPNTPKISEPEMPDPPALVVNDDGYVTDAKKIEEIRPTDLKPKEPEVEIVQELPRPVQSQPVINVQSAPVQARVDAPPSPRRSIIPKYPEGARKREEQGDVILELNVDIHGVVVDVKVVGGCGFRELEEAAMSAVRRATFRPAKRGKTPVPSTARIKLEFKLKK